MRDGRTLRARLANMHTYAVTPFDRDELLEVDLDALARNVEFLVSRGVRVVAVGGGTGEFEALTNAELEAVARTALETAGDRALVIPTLPGNLGSAADLAARYSELGALVALGMPPLVRGRIPADAGGVVEYYRALADACELPLVPYNTQRWTLETFMRLADVDAIVGVKDPCEDSHMLFRAIRELGDRFVWIGNKRHDPGVLHFRYQMGIDGFTSGMSNFLPEPELELHEAALARDWDRMVELQERVAPLERLRMASDDAASVKAGMDLVGLSGGRVRPPRLDLSDTEREALRSVLDGLGVATR